MQATITALKTVEIDDAVFFKAAEDMMRAFKVPSVTLQEVFNHLYSNGEVLVEVEEEDIEVFDGAKDICVSDIRHWKKNNG